MGAVIIVIILVLIIAILTIYNMSINKKIQDFKNLDKKFTNLNIIQDFVNITGNDMTVDDKIKAINNVIIEKYEIKYSTIVIFDGIDYIIKATNVDKKHWDTLSNLQDLDIFRDSISTTSPKYITVNNENEKLPYQQQEFGRAKSAIFSPLYIDNVYIGYWLIESGIPHDFDNIDITIFEVAKDNIISVLKAVSYQRILENIVRKDLFSGLNTAEYLYGDGKKIIDKYDNSAICMFKISNIEEINKISRQLGNKVITEISKHIKQSMSDSYLFVRYMGPKFVIVFCGVDTNSALDFINDFKSSTENLKISLDDENFTTEEIENRKSKKTNVKKLKVEVSPTLNFVISTYYKGTGIEAVLRKLENYIDDGSVAQHEINNI